MARQEGGFALFGVLFIVRRYSHTGLRHDANHNDCCRSSLCCAAAARRLLCHHSSICIERKPSPELCVALVPGRATNGPPAQQPAVQSGGRPAVTSGSGRGAPHGPAAQRNATASSSRHALQTAGQAAQQQQRKAPAAQRSAPRPQQHRQQQQQHASQVFYFSAEHDVS